MYPHGSLRETARVEELRRRLATLQPGSARHWGTMTAHEMICHLTDSFEAVLGLRPNSSVESWLSRTVVKWIALHTSLPWPHGVPTRPEVNPKEQGTRPADFESDRTRLLAFFDRFLQPDATCVPHPSFGAMSRDEWLLWGYGHMDHHLRQFGA